MPGRKKGKTPPPKTLTPQEQLPDEVKQRVETILEDPVVREYLVERMGDFATDWRTLVAESMDTLQWLIDFRKRDRVDVLKCGRCGSGRISAMAFVSAAKTALDAAIRIGALLLKPEGNSPGETDKTKLAKLLLPKKEKAIVPNPNEETKN